MGSFLHCFPPENALESGPPFVDWRHRYAFFVQTQRLTPNAGAFDDSNN
jgi:hypothetical protein